MNKQRERGHKRANVHWTPNAIFSFVMAAIVVSLLIVLTTYSAAISVVQQAYALVANGVLQLLRQHTAVHGNVVSSDEFGVAVVTACTGLFATTLFLVAVLLFPTSWGAKLLGGAIGIGGIAVINVVRLVSLYLVGLHWPTVLDVVHQLVWQSLLIVFAVSLWLIWAGRIAGPRRAAR